jgi:hypothetical protein
MPPVSAASLCDVDEAGGGGGADGDDFPASIIPSSAKAEAESKRVKAADAVSI